ncbi:MAG: XRE family transcriptional regulator [Alphaproteobacteria bacterium]|nr:XRE family transcriptional regulator [Alphaproteobacteria bacterium]
MGRTLNEVIEKLPKAQQDRIAARYRVLKDEVESLQALRKAAGKAQSEIASTLRISQPSVSKIEKQTDMYLSTLRNYVEAVGGDLELVVRFPKQEPLRLHGLGEVLQTKKAEGAPQKAGASRRKRA